MPNPTPIQVLPLMLKSFSDSIPYQIKFLPYYLLFIVIFIAIGIFNLYRFYRLSKAGIFEIDKMTGEEFEERLRILFTNLGYKAERTSPGKVKPDYGVDLVIEKNGIRTAVQAKCYRRQLVGEDAVREVYSGINYYHCNDALVVTNNNYSKMAWMLAKSDNVKLWNRNYLVKVLLTEKAMNNNRF